MKFIALVMSFVFWEANGYPYYPYFGNSDLLSVGSSDSSRGGMVLSRYYNPNFNGGMAAFMFRQPEAQAQVQPAQYYVPDRRRETPTEVNLLPPQENEVYYPQAPESYPQVPEKFPQTPQKPVTDTTEIAGPTEKTEVFPTTVKAVVPELTEPEVPESEEVEQKPTRKRVSKKKQTKRPAEDEEDEVDDTPKMPTGAFFPMYFGWGRNSGGAPGGATAIANAYSTGKSGIATSHAIAYGPPRPDYKYSQ